jgi:hypothetical protein
LAKSINNPGKLEFSAIIKDGGSGGVYVEFPYITKEVFGYQGRIPVLVHFDGQPYRGSMVRMGTSCHLIPLLKAIRKIIRKEIGDTVNVVVELDDQPRIIETPEDLQNALLENPIAYDLFRKLSYSHKREYVNWIEAAKKPETRERRILETIRKLSTQ